MTKYALECNNCTVSYPDFHLSFSFNVKEGELVCIIGPSGSGKSTLLSTICGLEKLSSGNISIKGRNVTTLPTEKRRVGMVFQDFALFPHLNTEQNVAFAVKGNKAVKKETADFFLKMTGLTGFNKRDVSTLSGGEKQRVALARTLAFDPDLLLFDEALSSVDVLLKKSLRKTIKDIQQKTGKAAVYVTHDTEEALEIADRIIVLHNGLIEQIGTPEEIINNPATDFVKQFILCK